MTGSRRRGWAVFPESDWLGPYVGQGKLSLVLDKSGLPGAEGVGGEAKAPFISEALERTARRNCLTLS